MFESETGYTVQTIAVGTGAALKMAEEGNADVLLVHAPAAEKALMDAGFGKDRFLVMHNDFVIVGPVDDPAGIIGSSDVFDAFKKFITAGQIFISRGDDSGTNKKEIELWSGINFEPKGQSWYLESGQGMGATLTLSSEKSAYTLTDRATFLALQGNLQLSIHFEGDTHLAECLSRHDSKSRPMAPGQLCWCPGFRQLHDQPGNPGSDRQIWC